MMPAIRGHNQPKRAFAVLPAGAPEPTGVLLIGRVDRFDLGAPLAVRIGAEIIILSEQLVDAEQGWDAVRNLSATPNVEVWVVADGQGRAKQDWMRLATRVLDRAGNAIEGASLPVGGEAQKQRPTRLAVVLGAKGGVGKTFLAANLAYFLATSGQSVAAVDLDVASGDLVLRLGIEPGIDLASVAHEQPEAAPEAWATSRRGLAIRTWASPPRPEFAAILDDVIAGIVLSAARSSGSTCAIVDTPMQLDSPAVLAALDLATSIVLVTTLTPAATRQARTTIDLLKRLNVSVRDTVVLVANRVSRRAPVDPSMFRDLVGQPPYVRLPELGVAADSESYLGCPVIASRAGRRLAEPLSRLAEVIVPGFQHARPAGAVRIASGPRTRLSLRRGRPIQSEERWI